MYLLVISSDPIRTSPTVTLLHNSTTPLLHRSTAVAYSSAHLQHSPTALIYSLRLPLAYSTQRSPTALSTPLKHSPTALPPTALAYSAHPHYSPSPTAPTPSTRLQQSSTALAHTMYSTHIYSPQPTVLKLSLQHSPTAQY